MVTEASAQWEVGERGGVGGDRGTLATRGVAGRRNTNNAEIF